MIDPTATVVLPENELTADGQSTRLGNRHDTPETDFDKTLVLEDELEKLRRRRSS